MRAHYLRIVADCEQRAARFIRSQNVDSSSPLYGGYVQDIDLTEPKSTLYHATTLLALYNTPTSRFYRSPEAFERVCLAMDYASRFQREDGTFDLLSCNFYSAPDTAFCIKRLLPAHSYLEKHLDENRNRVIDDKIRGILRRAAEGIKHGGFHTPNHRWAISSVLMACARIFNDPSYRERAEQYLAEGIDCNEKGEYAERSSGNYNRVNNDAMILLYEETGEPSYLDCVTRNLRLMTTYIEPDGSIFTKNSTRFDKDRKVYPYEYYFEYLYVSYFTRNMEFGQVANWIMKNRAQGGRKAPDCLMELMAYPQLIDYAPEGCAIPESYVVENPDSGIVRVRRPSFSYSILSGAPDFFTFQSGTLAVNVEIHCAFFTMRRFSADHIRLKSKGYVLEYAYDGWFYEPFGKFQGTSDWWAMDQSKRARKEGPELRFEVVVEEIENGAKLSVRTYGCDRVPVKMQIGIEPGTLLRADQFYCVARPDQALVARSGYIEAIKGNDALRIGPAFGSHFFILGHDDDDHGADGMFNLDFTDSTNFDHTITFERITGGRLSQTQGRP